MNNQKTHTLTTHQEETLKILADLATNLETAAANIKQQISELIGVNEKPTWEPAKIKWTTAEGLAGPYERSEDINSVDFKAMLKDLAEHQGKLTQNGYFYWIFRNGYTVGRKKRQLGESTSE